MAYSVRRFRRTRFWLCCLLLVPVLTACAFEGGPLNPLQRKLSWYSYLDADDIRAACRPGQPDRARLVYNAIHTEQIRTYELTPASVEQADNSVMILESRVLGPANLARLSDGILAPWLGDTSTTHLRAEDAARIWQAMDNSGAFDPAPEGLYLESEKFFWLTAVCRNGYFYYNAYKWPSDRFDAVQFDDLLFVWDMTGVEVNPPRAATNFDIYGDASPTKKQGAYYHVTIGENGLRGF